MKVITTVGFNSSRKQFVECFNDFLLGGLKSSWQLIRGVFKSKNDLIANKVIPVI
jgi:hypothetical protein